MSAVRRDQRSACEFCGYLIDPFRVFNLGMALAAHKQTRWPRRIAAGIICPECRSEVFTSQEVSRHSSPLTFVSTVKP